MIVEPQSGNHSGSSVKLQKVKLCNCYFSYSYLCSVLELNFVSFYITLYIIAFDKFIYFLNLHFVWSFDIKSCLFDKFEVILRLKDFQYFERGKDWKLFHTYLHWHVQILSDSKRLKSHESNFKKESLHYINLFTYRILLDRCKYCAEICH